MDTDRLSDEQFETELLEVPRSAHVIRQRQEDTERLLQLQGQAEKLLHQSLWSTGLGSAGSSMGFILLLVVGGVGIFGFLRFRALQRQLQHYQPVRQYTCNGTAHAANETSSSTVVPSGGATRSYVVQTGAIDV